MLRKLHTAHIAPKGFLATVDTKVLFEMAVLPEALSTLLALVRPLVAVDALVPDKAAAVLERAPAQLAHIRALSRVHAHVTRQTRLVPEASAAHVARVPRRGLERPRDCVLLFCISSDSSGSSGSSSSDVGGGMRFDVCKVGGRKGDIHASVVLAQHSSRNGRWRKLLLQMLLLLLLLLLKVLLKVLLKLKVLL